MALPVYVSERDDLFDGGYSPRRIRFYQRDRGLCWICGQPASFDDFHLGHIIDAVLGGKATRDNLVVMHPRCNQCKPLTPTREEAEAWAASIRAGMVRGTAEAQAREMAAATMTDVEAVNRIEAWFTGNEWGSYYVLFTAAMARTIELARAEAVRMQELDGIIGR